MSAFATERRHGESIRETIGTPIQPQVPSTCPSISKTPVHPSVGITGSDRHSHVVDGAVSQIRDPDARSAASAGIHSVAPQTSF